MNRNQFYQRYGVNILSKVASLSIMVPHSFVGHPYNHEF